MQVTVLLQTWSTVVFIETRKTDDTNEAVIQFSARLFNNICSVYKTTLFPVPIHGISTPPVRYDIVDSGHSRWSFVYSKYSSIKSNKNSVAVSQQPLGKRVHDGMLKSAYFVVISLHLGYWGVRNWSVILKFHA